MSSTTLPPPLRWLAAVLICARKENVTMSECPECGASLDLKNPEKGEIIVCPDCGVELEVRNASPVELSPAPQEEEDWGE
jgi:alpha-aminoadipate carrier protein LysW